jgi:hypothetical protein
MSYICSKWMKIKGVRRCKGRKESPQAGDAREIVSCAGHAGLRADLAAAVYSSVLLSEAEDSSSDALLDSEDELSVSLLSSGVEEVPFSVVDSNIEGW